MYITKWWKRCVMVHIENWLLLSFTFSFLRAVCIIFNKEKCPTVVICGKEKHKIRCIVQKHIIYIGTYKGCKARGKGCLLSISFKLTLRTNVQKTFGSIFTFQLVNSTNILLNFCKCAIINIFFFVIIMYFYYKDN